jgi:2-methylcitrate dehydratase PrpD
VDDESVAPGDVERVVVATFANGTDMDHTDPATLTAAKFSTPYVLARYLHDGAVTLDLFAEEAIADPVVRDLADRVELVYDEADEQALPEAWGARVGVELTDERTLRGERDYPRGDYRDPIPEAMYRERNRKLLTSGLPASRVDRAMAAFDEVRSRPVRATAAALTL